MGETGEAGPLKGDVPDIETLFVTPVTLVQQELNLKWPLKLKGPTNLS